MMYSFTALTEKPPVLEWSFKFEVDKTAQPSTNTEEIESNSKALLPTLLPLLLCLSRHL